MSPDDPISANSHAREDRLTAGVSSGPGSDPVAQARSLLRSVFQTGDADLWTVANVLVRPETRTLGAAIYADWTEVPESAPLEWVGLDVD
jgi:hypothetical protein